MPEDYNNTLNLPKTEFPMRGNLPVSEQERLNKWQEESIYEKLMENNKDKPQYILHDGPPYANGDIHLGTALNKILKDFVVRYKNMSGFKAPFVPGWDTHGLPTELKARNKAGIKSSAEISDLELRKMCKEFALSYIDGQREQFKRLGGIAQWDKPYITLLKEFEARQIEIFAQMACKGYIYKGLKPVYWCTECKTALAEAEIEYAQDPCKSIYVKFKLSDDKGKFSQLGIDISKIYFVIWTTTTWTLPGNVAICLGPKFDYSLIECDGEYLIMAKELIENTMKAAGKENYKEIAVFKGSELEYIEVEHPFLDRKSLVILGEHVTLESGTGCVHTAPGHGIEDFDACQNYKEIPIVVPVDASGKLTEEAGKFAGLSTQEANKEIAEYLKNNNLLFAMQEVIHQYPHCWRCKEPVLFRATEQWFCSIDDIKEQAMEEIKSVKWLPAWGEERITSMVRDRKDWCISRQRKWGVPIPIFFCEKCKEALIDYDVMMNIANIFREKGTDAWYELEAKDLLPKGAKCKKCGCSEFYKEKDIMDVWFDSGVTHTAVLEQRENLSWPADLYLEGGDQYRGWFQSSLLTSIASKGKAPYKSVVTHGMVVDGKGRKMSKSAGNGVSPADIVKKYGADILRLWVASSDYHADIRISDDILKQLSEAYRKIRNTARFILGNIYDFDPNKDEVNSDEFMEIDRWAICKLSELEKKVKSSYEKFEFYQVYHAVHNFCVVDMSNFYLDVIKDRLYVERPNSTRRRAAQTVMYRVLDSLVRIISPILAYTSDEIWQYMPHKSLHNKENIVYNEINAPCDINESQEFMNKWDTFHKLRNDVQKALEESRKEKIIGKALEASVEVYCDGELYNLLKDEEESLKTIFIVSQVKVIKGKCENAFVGESIKNICIKVQKAQGEKCERCWSHSVTVGQNKSHPTICERCAKILSE